MANPFSTFRAAEHADTMEGFLSLVAPDPLEQYFSDHSKNGTLFRRPFFIYGQPGSGKTTIARLFEPVALATILRNDSGSAFSAIRVAVAQAGAIDSDLISVLGARIPLESDFRDIANLPYSSEIKKQLLLRLIQSRTVLRWFSELQQLTITPEMVTVRGRAGLESSLDSIGGPQGAAFLERAKAVESAIYSIIGALVPPKSTSFSQDLQIPFHPFDLISEFEITSSTDHQRLLAKRIKLFVILDDAHSLNSDQFMVLRQWITRREISIGRWVLSRLDALSPIQIADEIGTIEENQNPGLTPQRDYEIVALQGAGNARAEARRKFKKVAAAISRRYLKQVEPFNRAHIEDLATILNTTVSSVQEDRLEIWRGEIAQAIAERGLSLSARQVIDETVNFILAQQKTNSEDLRVGLTRILTHRRSAIRQLSLFGSEEEPSFRNVDSAGLLSAAEIQLFRAFDRPFYYGFEQLALAASENAELFVRLAGALVDASLNLLARRQRPSLSPLLQHKLLREKATQLLLQWNFPESTSVKRLVAGIAARCARATDVPNAYLKSGANAFGIPMNDFRKIQKADPELGNVIKFGVAYSVFSISLDRSVKNENWCLLTLGGVACLHHRLTLALGGFVEGTAADLKEMISDS